MTGRAAVRRGGFTLLEVVVVLAIAGVLLAVVAPALLREARSSDPLAASADSVVRLLAHARRAAEGVGAPVELVIDPARRRWRARGGPVDTAGVIALHEGVILGGGERLRLRFDPRGPATGDAIVLRDGARALVVRAEPWTAATAVAGGGDAR